MSAVHAEALGRVRAAGIDGRDPKAQNDAYLIARAAVLKEMGHGVAAA